MDSNNQQPQEPVAPHPVPQQVTQTVQKISSPKILLTFLLLLIVLGLIGGAYYLGTKNNPQIITKNNPQQVSSKPGYPNSNFTSEDNIPKGFQSLNYAVVDDKVVLQYRNKYYKEDTNSLTPAPTTTLENPKNYKWMKLIYTPIILDPDAVDKVFSFHVIPGTKNFFFVMEWASTVWTAFINGSPAAGKGIGDYYAYYYNAVENRIYDVKLTGPTVVDQISNDKNFASVIEYGCWGCDGHKTPLALINLQNLTVKDIGKVENFVWGENGNYSYKEYKIIPCSQPTPGDCTQDLATLPTLKGKF